MVIINSPLPALSPDVLDAFYTTDELLSGAPVLAFHGPSVTTTAITSTSRIQVHIFTPAGFQTYPRLTVSPSSPLYAAVECLAQEEQGDEICRALAFSLFKYFSDLSVEVKQKWEDQSNAVGKMPNAPPLFSQAHAAIIASHMVKVENNAEVIEDVQRSLGEQTLSWMDLDVVLPPGSMRAPANHPRESNVFEESEEYLALERYGSYAPVVKLFGEVAFLPTSKLRRAPSKSSGLKRSLAFSRTQKETLRREMCELLDTEESYVRKIDDLIHSVAQEFRDKAKAQNQSSSSPSAQALKELFPPSLDRILTVNREFLEDIRTILEETENDAIGDIESTTDGTFIPPQTREHMKEDVTGSLAFAKSLITWFPKFAECYASYIQAHSQFPHFLKIYMKEIGSSFSKRVHETGEQRLTSMLIEPVQRLPRYNLYIDNILKQLPARHPALKPLLKARDIITDICSNDSHLTQQTKVLETLKRTVAAWPLEFQPDGRLITAMDVVEVSPPFNNDLNGPSSSSGVFLLFAGHLVLLHKPNYSNMSARTLMAEVDNPKPIDSSTNSRMAPDLILHHVVDLHNAYFSEMGHGRMVQLISKDPSVSGMKIAQNGLASSGFIKTFQLTGLYEGKAVRWIEEFTKAKVEGRFSETERDSHQWEVRNSPGQINLFSAMFEEAQGQMVEGRKQPSAIRIVVDADKGSQTIDFGDQGVEVAASLTVVGDGMYRLEIEGLNGYASCDDLVEGEFLPVLTKRLSNLLQLRNHIRNPLFTGLFISRNQQILNSIKVITDGVEEEVRPTSSSGFRAPSPVKMLSNLFGGSINRGDSTARKLQRAPATLGDIPKIMPPELGRKQSVDQARPKSAGKASIASFDMSSEAIALTKLEDSLVAYILALHARKGNVVGRVVRSRAAADELAVNELYNVLLEDPSSHEAPAQAQVDVLFAAFEKFLTVAWKEKMGPVISQQVLDALLSKSDNLYPGDFEEFFRQNLSQLAPQNQRALSAIVRLLADLLSGTSNDGDRGMLTASFAEIIVSEGNPIDYVSLIDRFVEDVETLFNSTSGGFVTPSKGSFTSESRMRMGNTSSLASNASSLRRKFGFGTLSRENSRSDIESKLGSVLRTLSKTGRVGEGQPSSLSKAASLGRSRSTDIDGRVSPKRPGSRDRPTVLGAFSFEDSPTQSGRSFIGLDTIGEVPGPSSPPRKKRRSSLSDLKSLQHISAHNTPKWSPHTPRKIDHINLPSREPSASPSTPSIRRNSQIPSPFQHGGSVRLSSPGKKETLAPVSGPRQTPSIKAATASTTQDAFTVSNHTPSKRRNDSISGIPTFKTSGQNNPLSERPTSGNIPKLSVSTTKTSASAVAPSKKLRMQSPQKLRERLQSEQKAIASAQSSLHAELGKIGEELTKSESTRQTGAGKRPAATSSSLRAGGVGSQSSQSALLARVLKLEAELATTSSSLSNRTEAIAADVSSSLKVSETRAKEVDELCRQANAENEALYSRFNEELARVAKNIKAGQGVEELKAKLKEAQEETIRLKRENGRLKRENVGLRAQLKD